MAVLANQGRQGALPWSFELASPGFSSGLYFDNEYAQPLTDSLSRVSTAWDAKVTGAKHYSVCHLIFDIDTADLNILGVGRTEFGNIIRIYRIEVIHSRIAAGWGAPLRVWRVTGLGGGTVILPENIPRRDTLAPLSTANVRLFPTATRGLRHMMVLGGSPVDLIGRTAAPVVWRANREEEEIVLRGDEGIVLATGTRMDLDDRIVMTVHWRED